MTTKSNRIVYLSVAVCSAIIVALDQATKWWILERFSTGEILEVVSGIFNLTLTFNRGAAFGIFSTLGPGVREFALLASTAVALGVVGYFLKQKQYQSVLPRTALSLIIGGAVGNIIDRAVHGAVVDFLDFYYGSYHWPAFNVADSAICIGVGLLIFYQPQSVVSAPPSHNTP